MKFPVVAYIFLGLFVVTSIVQLVFAFIEREDLRRKEKFACLLSLSLFAIFVFPNKPLVYIGALLGMAGDILDLQPKTFYLGVVAFFLGHICYTSAVIVDVLHGAFPWYMYMIYGLTFVAVAAVMFIFCRKSTYHSKLDCIGQSLYFAILASYLPVFIYATVVAGGYIFLSLIGACFFIISDSILVKTHFGKKFKSYHFYIMGTYLIAEVLIILGFILTFTI